jgi:phospholipase C
MSRVVVLLIFSILLSACEGPALLQPTITPASTVSISTEAPVIPPSETAPPVVISTVSPTPTPLVPDFSYIVMMVFENKEFGIVIGNLAMPVFNRYAKDYTLLTQHYAITHPSLPNYLALMGGDTFGIASDCNNCFVNAPSLPDYIEASGRTWKTYQEDLPKPCFVGDKVRYVQKHDPFIYFDPIRTDLARCERSVVPLTDLDGDLAAGTLPNFSFIMPNLCNSAHDSTGSALCAPGVSQADAWLKATMDKLLPALDATGQPYLIILTWDEGNGDHSCCGLPEKAGGRIPTVLVSPQVKNGFEDPTPYTHYSILKTISQAWGLPYLGHADDETNTLIVAPWK